MRGGCALIFGIVLGLTLALPGLGWGRSSLEARVDRTDVDVEGAVRLQVTVRTNLADGREPGELAMPELSDWELVSQMQQQSFINSESSQGWTLVLRPRKTGKLTIGAFTLKADGKTQKTAPIAITVTGEPPAAPPPTPGLVDQSGTSGAGPPVIAQAPDPQAFLLWEVDKRHAWLGEQLFATLALYVNRTVAVADHKIGSVSTEGFWSEPLPQNRMSNQQVQIGREVFVRSPIAVYRLFPLRSGDLRLPAVHADLVLASRSLIGGRRSRQARDAASVAISVKPLPTAGQPAGFAGPAVGRVTLQAHVDRTQVLASNGLQLTVTSTVDGMLGNLPEPKLETPDFRIYAPTTDTQVQNQGRNVTGVRISRYLLKPLRTGRLTLPSLTLPYFDPATGSYATATTSPISIEVSGTVNEPTPGPQTSSGPGRAKAGGAASKPAVQGDDALAGLRTLRMQSALEPSRGPAWAHPVFPVVLAVPPLLFFGLLGWQRWRLFNEAGAEGRAVRRAAADARREMERLTSMSPPRAAFAELSRLLLTFLEVRLALSVRGLTEDALRRRLLDGGLPAELVTDLAQELVTCDFSRFSPGELQANELHEAIRRATELVTRVDRHAGGAG